MKLFAGAGKYSASTVVLVVANLIPLIGVIAWDWSAFNVVALYWIENVIIGGITILKMLACSPDEEGMEEMVERMRNKARKAIGKRGKSRAISSGSSDEQAEQKVEQQLQQFKEMSANAGCMNHGTKLFFIPFFTVHYGLFCAVHGFFVMVLLGGDKPLMAGGGLNAGPIKGAQILVEKVIGAGGVWFVLALLGSHLFSYFTNYIGKGENRKTVVPQLMMSPYPRIVVLHVAIIFGAFVILALGSSLFMLVLLVFGKILIDLALHLNSHQKLEDVAAMTAAEDLDNQTT